MRLPGGQEFLARSLECDTAREIDVVRKARRALAEGRRAVHRLRFRMADGQVTMAEAQETLREVEGLLAAMAAVLEDADVSLLYNKIHNELMCALRADLDPRGAKARARFPLLRLLDTDEGTVVGMPAAGEPEAVVA